MGGRLFYKKKLKINKKVSKKELKFIKQNEERQKLLEIEKNRKYLDAFFRKYKVLTQKQKLLELEKPSPNDYILLHILLLRIEFFYKEWKLEERKQNIDESKLLPLYLNSIEFFEVSERLYNDLEMFDETKLQFVVEKMVECNF